MIRLQRIRPVLLVLPALVTEACFQVKQIDPGPAAMDGSVFDGGQTDNASDQAGDTEAPMAPTVPLRLIAPLSTATVTSRRPTLRWALGGGTDGAHVQMCLDRACANTVAEFDAVGTSGAPALDLPAGVLFWRAYGRMGTVTNHEATPTWQFTVGARSAAVDRSWGMTLDLNGDGLGDVVVGAPGASDGLGRAYVYLGSASGLSPSPSTTLVRPDSAPAAFGASVKSAGDVNGDGLADLLVATTGRTLGGSYTYSGSPIGVSTAASATLVPEDAMLGVSFLDIELASAGDLNGDGYADIVTAIVSDGMSADVGTIGTFLGSATGLPPGPPVTYKVVNVPDRVFVLATSSAGDVNGDGYADVIVGAYVVDPTTRVKTGVSRLFIYEGSAVGLTLPSAPFAIGDVIDSVACAGDVNGDGYADVIVGSVSANGNRLRATFPGGAFAYLGSATGLSTMPSAAPIGPDGDGSAFGSAVASAGDVNGDGYADVIIGAPGADGGAGRAHVYLGGAMGLSMTMPPVTLTGPDGKGGSFGASVASAGDVNGDGHADVIVGAPGAEGGAGRAYIYLGNAVGLSTTPSVTLIGPDGPGGHFGSSVAGAE
jgi:FG-GAP repeat/FG-GAP-like repeat